MTEKTDKPARLCLYSGTPFVPHRAGQVYCCKTCALAHARQLAEKAA